MIMGTKVPENGCSRKRKFARIFVPGSKSSRERIGQGTNWPGSYWPGSAAFWERSNQYYMSYTI